MYLICGLAACLLDLRPPSDCYLLLYSCQKVRPLSPCWLSACAAAGWHDCMGSGFGNRSALNSVYVLCYECEQAVGC